MADPSSAAASTSASALDIPDATRAHLDGLARQFDVSDERLVNITHQFVDDFALGLGEYNEPMAMM